MKILSFLMRYSPAHLLLAVIAGVISGICNAGLLAVFNLVITGAGGAGRTALIPWFAALCLALPLTRFFSEHLLASLSQGALFNLRLQLSKQILSTPLRHLENLGNHRLMTALTEDIPTITGTLLIVPVLCINVGIIISGLIYLAWLSRAVFLATLAFMILGIITYQASVLKAVNSFKGAREDADKLFNHFRDLTDGVKELKLHNSRRKAFLSEILKSTAASFRRRNTTGLKIYALAASWGQVLLFILVGLILFASPSWEGVSTQTLVGYTITLLYLVNPFQVIMNTTPTLSRANVALEKVESLGIELKAGGTEAEPELSTEPRLRCESIELVDVSHSYYVEGENTSFTLGPINMRLVPGELVFLVGGNGSGKTTLAKLLTGLYSAESGEVRLNGQAITDENRELYRQLFSTVFSDYHLFDSLMGLEGPHLDRRAHDHLVRLQLDHKVEIRGGALSTTELSQGQRKRLALLTAYLEDRPVYVLDEWAADQDSIFKEIFYNDMLPELRNRGKAVLVISHDDRYYGVADRIIKLESGKIEYDRPLNRPLHA